MRRDTRARPLDERELDPDPIVQFGRWFDEARDAELPLPEAMALATATGGAEPSVRMVLLKEHDDDGFSFFSGYESRKGQELDQNPRAALLFYWHELGRQVRVEGTVERLPHGESEAYFRTRPRPAQIAAAASRQGRPLSSRAELEAQVDKLERELEGRDVPLPAHWGGYRLRPEAYEFWQHRENRLHDRFRYTRARGSWAVERLAP